MAKFLPLNHHVGYIADMEKLCGVCGTHKPPSDFYRVPVGPKGTCKVCSLVKVKARYIAHPIQRPPDGLKRCSRCREIKPNSEFTTHRGSRDGLAYYCRPCGVVVVTASRKKNPEAHRKGSRDWAAANPTKVRDTRLKKRLGLETGGYDRMLDAQHGKCAICYTTKPAPDPRFRYFHVDHDSITGRVRGLLCSRCNIGIGQLLHDKVILRSAIKYLSRK